MANSMPPVVARFGLISLPGIQPSPLQAQLVFQMPEQVPEGIIEQEGRWGTGGGATQEQPLPSLCRKKKTLRNHDETISEDTRFQIYVILVRWKNVQKI